MEKLIRRLIRRSGRYFDTLWARTNGAIRLEDLIESFYTALDAGIGVASPEGDAALPWKWTLRISSRQFPGSPRGKLDRWLEETASAGDQYLADHRQTVARPIQIVLEEVADLPTAFEFVAVTHPAGLPMDGLMLSYDNRAQPPVRLGKALASRRAMLGRSHEADIVVDDPSVSRFHATLSRDQEGDLYISDCASANGTFVNGEAVHERRQIRPGDEVQLGSVKLHLDSQS